MKTFKQLLREGTFEETREQWQIAYRLADASLTNYAECNGGGRAIYAALSQLSKVPELEINMAHFDNLMFIDNALINPEVYYYALAKLKELDELMRQGDINVAFKRHDRLSA